MNEIKIFENTEFGSIRTLEIDGNPYFVGKDVTDILGYQNGSRDINRHVDEDDRHKVNLLSGIEKPPCLRAVKIQMNGSLLIYPFALELSCIKFT